MNKKCVIIGAGQTGRGYINRILNNNNQSVVFLDSDENIIRMLNQENYEISFGDSDREPILISNYQAIDIKNEKAIEHITSSDYVFTSVGASNLVDLIELLRASLRVRKKDFPLRLITCENGVNVSKVFESLKKEYNIEITEAIVFCTTLEAGINIVSEDLDWIPYDVTKLSEPLEYKGFFAERNFSDLMKRKIYTYNCLSAVVAYLGFEYGYENYALAANDIEISDYMQKIKQVLDIVISKEFSIDLNEQEEFSNNAILKFKNKSIKDTISRNTRDSKRKLLKDERIISPLLLINKHSKESEELLDVCSCACHYGLVHKELEKNDVVEILKVLPKSWSDYVIEKIEYLNSQQ